MKIEDDGQPTLPRPPAAEIERVYHDLATQLSGAELDAANRRAMSRDALQEKLKHIGHSLAAIEWAIHLFCKEEILSTTILKTKKVKAIRRGVCEAKAEVTNVRGIAASDEFWERWKAGSFSPRAQETIVLVHGIRTFAGWQPMVKRVLEEIPNTKVVPVKYGYLDAFRFWVPFITRQTAIDDVRLAIGNAKNANPDSRISVIAHSFGTYAISEILEKHPDLKLHRLILSGAIIRRSFHWHHIKEQLATDVVNDYGTRDIWPVLAKCLSWGYGDTGRHGFGSGAYVIDRGHDYGHSDFFNEEFVRDYWKPWFEKGMLVSSPWAEKAPAPSWLLGISSAFPVKFFLTIVILVLSVWLPYMLMHNQGSTTPPANATSNFNFDATTIAPPSEIEPQLIDEYSQTPHLSGFDIKTDVRLVDLRQLNDVPKSLSTTRHSPANFKRSVTLLRKSVEATEFVARNGTSGIGVDARCLSHPYSIRFAGTRPNSKRSNFLKNFEVVVDVSREPIDSVFVIDLEATSWNAFQGKEEWVGFDAYESSTVGKKVLTVLLPARKPFSNLYIQATREGDDDVLPLPERLILRKDEFDLGFSWEVENPPPDMFLETRWTW